MRILFRRRASRRRAAVQWTEGILLAAGLVAFGWFGYNWIAAQADQIWSNYSLDASLAGEQPSAKGLWDSVVKGEKHPTTTTTENTQETPQVASTPRKPHRRHVPSGEDLGRIEIPRLRISAIVRQGVDDNVLSRAVGHVPSTALPGEKGNVGLAAHRDSYFRNLRDVKEGDTIRIVTSDGTWEYSVQSTQIVQPTNVEVLDPTDHASITLVTCYPFNYVGHAPKRFIVRARLLQDDTAAPRAASVSKAASKTPTRRRS